MGHQNHQILIKNLFLPEKGHRLLFFIGFHQSKDCFVCSSNFRKWCAFSAPFKSRAALSNPAAPVLFAPLCFHKPSLKTKQCSTFKFSGELTSTSLPERNKGERIASLCMKRETVPGFIKKKFKTVLNKTCYTFLLSLYCSFFLHPVAIVRKWKILSSSLLIFIVRKPLVYIPCIWCCTQ